MAVKIQTSAGTIEITNDVIATVVGGAATDVLDVYTIISYGTKISEVSRNVQEKVKYNLEALLGVTANSVNVFVQGVRVLPD